MSAPSISGGAETKVQETADDAAISKLSAVRQGYFKDPFLSFFVRRTIAKRSPLINRGYFARMAALELIIRRFLAVCSRSGTPSQIVSLGAGLDTTFFRLWLDDVAPTTYFEVDFPDITARKGAILRSTALLRRAVGGTPITGDEVLAEATRAAEADAAAGSGASPCTSGGRRGHHSSSASGSGAAGGASSSSSSSSASSAASSSAAAEGPTVIDGVTFSANAVGGVDVSGRVYRLLTADLRDIASLQAVLRSGGIDTSLPTLFLSECVLVYLQPEESCSIIAWAAHSFPRSVFVTYEQIRPHDAFGHMMARNLAERGYTLRGLHAFPDIASQTARYRELGYTGVTVADMNDIYYRLLPRSEVARIERLEWFDEVEEWHLMSAHYCIAVAVNDASADLTTVIPSASSSSSSSSSNSGTGAPASTSTLSSSSSTAAANASVTHAQSIISDVLPEAVRHPHAPSHAVTTAAGSGSGVGGSGAHRAHGDASGTPVHHAMDALAPQEIAANVVKAHEAAASADRSSSSSLSAASPAADRHPAESPLPSAHAASACGGAGGDTTATAATGGRGGLTPLRAGSGGSAPTSARSRSASDVSASGGLVVPAGDMNPSLMNAIQYATGTAVESVELTPTPSPTSTGTPLAESTGAPTPATDSAVAGASSSHSLPSAFSAAPLSPTSSVNAHPHAAASSASAGIGRIHTHACDIVLTSSASAHMDFGAIAEAQSEMAHARQVREQAGLEALRQRASRVAASVGWAATGGAASSSAGVSSSSSSSSEGTGTGSSGKRHGAGGGASGGCSSLASALGVVPAASAATGVAYDAESVKAASVPANLYACLYPMEHWRAPVPAKAATAAMAFM